jgi:hypothetical protein
MQVSLYHTTIDAKHNNARNHHCHNSPLSLINQHVESIKNVLYCMPLPMNKGKLSKLNKEFAHADPRMILHWAVRQLLPLPLNDDPMNAMITFKPKLACFRMLNMDGDTIGLVKKQAYDITGPATNKGRKKSHNTDCTGLHYRLHWKRK